MESQAPKILSNYVGKTLKFKSPSGSTITIREQNGNDDDILSSSGDDGNGLANFNEFVKSIVVDLDGKKYLSDEDILQMKTRDKYYILLKSRIHSLGKDLKFTHTCSNPRCHAETLYEEDLTRLDWDMSKSEKPKDLSPHAIDKYLNGNEKTIELALSSGKKIKYTCLDGFGEKRLLDRVDSLEGKTTINLALTARGLQILNPQDGEWMYVSHFGIFSSKDMAEMRKSIDELDSQFTMSSDIKCPKCGYEQAIPLISNADFFFPSLT